MIPRFLRPTEWLGLLDGLPREGAVVALFVSLSMLALGLWCYRYYLCLGAAVAGWVGGLELAELMHVTRWYVALPCSLAAGGAMWPLSPYAMPLLIGLASACCGGLLASDVMQLGSFWIGFSLGMVVGGLMSLVAQRFATTVFFAAVGAVGTLVCLGEVVSARHGLLSPGAYLRSPLAFVIVGTVLFVVATLAQVALAPEDPMVPHTEISRGQ